MMTGQKIKKPIKCFLLGYIGANNTGADARLCVIVDELEAVFDDRLVITIGTLNCARTKSMFSDKTSLRIIPIPHIFVAKLLWLVATHHITVLVEGSTFKQSWSSALFYAFCSGAIVAKLLGRKCIAYAVDAGELSNRNIRVARWVGNRLDLLITRSDDARSRMLGWNVKNKIHATADPAFLYNRRGRCVEPGLHQDEVTIVPVEFYEWPVKAKLFGSKETIYRWPFFFSWSKQRQEASDRLVDDWVSLIAHIVGKHTMKIRLIAMEQLDDRICHKILDRVSPRVRSETTMHSSRTAEPNEIVQLLRSSRYVITSRYHAAVLSMDAWIPQMALAHDERLETLYDEIGLSTKYLVSHDNSRRQVLLLNSFDRLVQNGDRVSALIHERLEQYFVPKSKMNVKILSEWYVNHLSDFGNALSKSRAIQD